MPQQMRVQPHLRPFGDNVANPVLVDVVLQIEESSSKVRQQQHSYRGL
jgi:hypothetical protein